MKVLTVQQPWAWAIFHGKDVENRTQLFKYRGPLAIHAGARWSDRGAHSPLVAEACVNRWPIRPENPAGFAEGIARHGLQPGLYPTSLSRMGAILGTVDLVDAHHEHDGCCESPWAESSYVEAGGAVRTQIVHLMLENPVEFATPVLGVKGRLGIWTPDAELSEAIYAEAAQALTTPGGA